MGKHVSDLKRKLELLKRHSRFKTTKAVAEELEVAVSTLNGWTTGSPKSPPESMPEERLSVLISMFTEILPPELKIECVTGLVMGGSADLENALLANCEKLLEDIIAKDAQRNTGHVHRRQSIGLDEHDENDEDYEKIRIGERFMIEFTTKSGGFLLVLQNVQQTWEIVRFADGAISPKLPAGSILVPGIREARFVYMHESNQSGRHRFILFVSPRPFPRIIHQAATTNKNLDWQMLSALSGHYSDQAAHLREVHLLSVSIR